MKSDRALPVLLPDEVMMEILSWLPVKLLIRFTCVCKSWKSLISDPIFVKLHLLHISPNNANLVIILNSTKTFQYPQLLMPLRPPPPQRVMFCSKASFFHNPLIATTQQPPLFDDRIIGSCNGLVCCLKGSFSHSDFRVHFWNPERRLESGYSPCLPFDILDIKFVYPIFGFGYDNSSDTYKVVAILHFHNGGRRGRHGEELIRRFLNITGGPMENLRSTERSKPIRVKVYTMGEHCWRDIQTFPAFLAIYPTTFRNEGSFLRGTLNWLATRNLFSRCYKDLLIVSLDLGKETYKQFSLPPGYDDEIGDGPPYIAILGDCLCLFLDVNKTDLVVWQMNEFGVEKSWTQIFKVSYQHIRIRIGEQVHFFSLVPLCTTENGIVLTFVNNRKSGIFLYNWRDDTVTVGNYDNKLRIDAAKDHVQSLIMPC